MFLESVIRFRGKSGELSNPLKPCMIVAAVGIVLDVSELFTIDRRAIFIPTIRCALSTVFLAFYFRKSIFAWHVGLIDFATAVALIICGYAMDVRLFKFTIFGWIVWPTACIIVFFWLLALKKPYTAYLNSAVGHNLEG